MFLVYIIVLKYFYLFRHTIMASSISFCPPDRKRALIIGNNEYKHAGKLQCCTNDARDMQDALESIHFNVTIGTNLTFHKMTKRIHEFAYETKADDLVIFFFAGHGTQWTDQNFLIPVDDDQIKHPEMVKQQAINVQDTLTMIMSHNPFAVIILLDCCRSYLFPNEATNRTLLNRGGLSAMKQIAGSLIVFACDANQTTPDQSSTKKNGLFTTHLLKHIARPNMSIDEVMTRVCADIVDETNGGQRPYRLSCLSRVVYLNYTKKDSKFADLINESSSILL